MDRTAIAGLIASRLDAEDAALRAQYAAAGYFIVDDLLPEPLARDIHARFPDPSAMMLRKSLRELKYVTAQMDRCASLLQEIVFAFQDPRVVAAVARATALEALEPDPKLYAGGVSLMGQGHYLNPHIDNSHDMDRARYRVLNLLYYVSPDWADRGRRPSRALAARHARRAAHAAQQVQPPDRHRDEPHLMAFGERGARRSQPHLRFQLLFFAGVAGRRGLLPRDVLPGPARSSRCATFCCARTRRCARSYAGSGPPVSCARATTTSADCTTRTSTSCRSPCGRWACARWDRKGSCARSRAWRRRAAPCMPMRS